MIQLNKEDFTNLLTDFYATFAPQKLSSIQGLIDKYGDTSLNQRNAIQTAYIIYYQSNNPNYKNFSNILPDVGTEKNIIKLMESYSRGERILSSEKQQQIIKEEETKRLNDIKAKEEKNKEQEDQKFSKIEKSLKEEVEQLKKQLEQTNKNPSEIITQNIFEEMNVEIISFLEPIGQDEFGKTKFKDFDYSNLIMPAKKYISTLCIGQRLMLKDQEGTVVGVEVTNIYDDYVSSDIPTRLLELKKV